MAHIGCKLWLYHCPVQESLFVVTKRTITAIVDNDNTPPQKNPSRSLLAHLFASAVLCADRTVCRMGHLRTCLGRGVRCGAVPSFMSSSQ